MTRKRLIFASVVALAIASFAQQAPARTSTDEHHSGEASMRNQHGFETHGLDAFKVEFENEGVQVVCITIGPHEKIPMHDLTPRVVVLLTDQDLKVTLPNGESREGHHKAGESMWVSAGRHSGELSDKPIGFIAVIPRQK